MSMLMLAALSWAEPWCDAIAAGLEANTVFDPSTSIPGAVRTDEHGIGPYLVVVYVRPDVGPQAADLEACAAAHGWPRAVDAPVETAFTVNGARISFYPVAEDGLISVVPPPPHGREPALIAALDAATVTLANGVRDGVPGEEVAMLQQGVGVEAACDPGFDGVCRVFAPMSTATGCGLAAHGFALAAAAMPRFTQAIDVTCTHHRARASITRDGPTWTARVAVANRFAPRGEVLGDALVRDALVRPLTPEEHGDHTPADPVAWQEVLRHASQTQPGPGTDALQVGVQLAALAGLPTALVLAAAVNPGVHAGHRHVYYGNNAYTCLGHAFLSAGRAVTSGSPTLDDVFCANEVGQVQKGSIVVGFGEGDAMIVVVGWIGDDLGLPWASERRGVTASVVGNQVTQAE